jgi:hypothetical protein
MFLWFSRLVQLNQIIGIRNCPGYLDKSSFIPNHHIHDQVMSLAESAGSEGVSLLQAEQNLGLSKLDARCVVRKLHKRKDLIAVTVSRGRQKICKSVTRLK